MNPPISYANAAARNLTRKGVAAARAGRSEEAVGHYRAALAQNPSHMPAHLNLASLLLHSGQAEAAIEACQAATSLAESKQHPYLWLVSGMAKAELGQRWEAEEDLLYYQDNAPDPRFTRVVWRTLRELDRSAAFSRAA
jgi:tetratricopeptide (TPR) repeat protein